MWNIQNHGDKKGLKTYLLTEYIYSFNVTLKYNETIMEGSVNER